MIWELALKVMDYPADNYGWERTFSLLTVWYRRAVSARHLKGAR
ncbi:hypothetical protein AWB64_00462 [Caballeronia sordidicola]|uniref:Uncharacterized protein n=1 Tax=Caballeronia sordidicola TaxID=196367 RepID=A0A158EWR7_CABSO|nr:hypothetical protein AWB64_00462 [Caballeronia sordidicola]